MSPPPSPPYGEEEPASDPCVCVSGGRARCYRKESPLARQRGITMLTYLAIRAMIHTGCNWMYGIEAVQSTSLDHPEWDLNERQTWEHWDKRFGMTPLD